MRGAIGRLLDGRRDRAGLDPATFVPESASPAVVATQRQMARRARSSLLVWLSKGGWIALAIPVLIVLVSGIVLGPSRTGELLLGVTSPIRGADGWLDALVAWSVATIGWLGAPALVGAIVGYSLASTLSSYRSRTLEEIIHSVGRSDE